MPGRKTLCLGVTLLVLLAGPARAGHGPGHSGAGHQGPHHHPGSLGAVGGFAGGYGFPYFATVGPAGVYTYVPTFLVIGPGGLVPPVGSMIPPPGFLRGPLLPPPPRELLQRRSQVGVRPVSVRRVDPARATQLMTLGDRLLRAGNLKKSEERYQQALHLLPDQATPYLRLAQIALVRGHFTEAANWLREAETAQPGWLATAPDIEAIYGEPSEFARHIARLESYVQAHPADRDAWLVLGAQWFLSGRTTKAADVFLRLSDPDRKPDIALAAFLEASNQAGLKAEAAPDGRDPPR